MAVNRRLAGTVAAIAVLMATIYWQAGSSAMSTASILPGWWPSALGWTGFVIVGIGLAGVAVLGDVAARSDDVRSDGMAGSISSAIQAFGIVLVAYVAWVAFDSWSDVLQLWVAIPVIVIGWIGFTYFQHRRDVATASTALSRTRRTTERDVSSYAEATVGVVVLALAFVFAVLSGSLTALGGLGDVLLPFAPEFAYIFSVAWGYVSLGGDVIVFGWLPELTAFQYAAMAMIIGGIAIMVKQ